MVREVHALTFWGHIDALRAHLIAAAVCFGLALALVLVFLGPLVSLLTVPLGSAPLVFLSPLGSFAFQMRVACIGAFLLSLGPWTILLLHFLSPALSRSARRWSWAILLSSLAMSVAAVIATLLWALPWSLGVLRAASIPGSELLLTADSYLDLFSLEALFVALLLQLPLVLAVLTLWGWVDPRWLSKRRDILYLALVIVVAVVTPTTDIISLLIAMVPATLSLEAGLFAAHLIHIRRQRVRARGDTMNP